jgi:ribosomal protein S8
MIFTNHLISNLIYKINYGTIRRIRFIIINYNDSVLELLEILYNTGVIRSYRIIDNLKVKIYLKYYLCHFSFKLSVISTPGNRIYWTLNKLSKNYNIKNFSGFYIISTQKGLLTSDYCLTNRLTGGEILIKVEI